ncbi:hypothetical protein BSKO_05785 [Bryopsis sp. KO-2023]|nr:hypothetical protein BSKO_05785 [Bryopsis sp. KO-2023]
MNVFGILAVKTAYIKIRGLVASKEFAVNRLAFARHIVSSNDELLPIASSTKSALAVQSFPRKYFEGIDPLKFGRSPVTNHIDETQWMRDWAAMVVLVVSALNLSNEAEDLSSQQTRAKVSSQMSTGGEVITDVGPERSASTQVDLCPEFCEGSLPVIPQNVLGIYSDVTPGLRRLDKQGQPTYKISSIISTLSRPMTSPNLDICLRGIKISIPWALYKKVSRMLLYVEETKQGPGSENVVYALRPAIHCGRYLPSSSCWANQMEASQEEPDLGILGTVDKIAIEQVPADCVAVIVPEIVTSLLEDGDKQPGFNDGFESLVAWAANNPFSDVHTSIICHGVWSDIETPLEATISEQEGQKVTVPPHLRGSVDFIGRHQAGPHFSRHPKEPSDLGDAHLKRKPLARTSRSNVSDPSNVGNSGKDIFAISGQAADFLMGRQDHVDKQVEALQKQVEHLTKTLMKTEQGTVEICKDIKVGINDSIRKITKGCQMKIGLDRQLSTTNQMEALQGKCEELQLVSEEVEQMMVGMTTEKEPADEKKKFAAEKENDVTSAEVMAVDAEKKLDEVQAAIRAVDASLKNISRDDIVEVKSFRNPPRGVRFVVNALSILLGVESKNGKKCADNWEEARKLVHKPNKVLEQMREYNKGAIKKSALKKLEGYVKKEEFLLENIQRSSQACISISTWVRSVYAYHKASLQGRKTSEILKMAQARILGNQEPQSAVLQFKDSILAWLMDIFDPADIKQAKLDGKGEVQEQLRKVIETELTLKQAEKIGKENAKGVGGQTPPVVECRNHCKRQKRWRRKMKSPNGGKNEREECNESIRESFEIKRPCRNNKKKMRKMRKQKEEISATTSEKKLLHGTYQNENDRFRKDVPFHAESKEDSKLIAVAAGGQAYEDVSAILQEQLNGPAVQNILSKIPGTFRSDAEAFIRRCTQAANSLTIKGSELSGFVNGATASDECCRATYEVAHQGCMCDGTAWNEMVRLFSGAGGGDAAFKKLVSKCNTGGRSFQAVMNPTSASCSKDNIANAKAFTC